MSMKIAIIGANRQQNPLILKAKELGYETHTFSWQSGDDLGAETSDHFYAISAGNKEEILEQCRKIGVDAVISIGSDIAAVTTAYVAERLGLVGNTYNSAVRATNKLAFRAILTELGFPQPKHLEIGDAIPFDALAELSYPLVIKPSDRSGGRGVVRIDTQSEFFPAVNYARDVSFERKAIAEEYVSGTLYSCECFSIRGTHYLLGYTQRDVMSVNGKMYELRHTFPAILPASVEKQLEREIPLILDSLGLSVGASSVEFIVDADNAAHYIEVSPSLCGDYIGTDLMAEAAEIDLLKLLIETAVGKEVEIPVLRAKSCATVEFIYSKTEGYENAPEYPDGIRYGHRITVAPIKTFGGCPSLRLEKREPYYSENENTVLLNSEYTAFWYALRQLDTQCVHIPYYAAPAWSRVAAELGIECKYYHIDRHFLPVDVECGDDDAVLLVNYHGLCTKELAALPVKKKIIDNSTAFFTQPVYEKGTYNIYSCRKFFAVTDGAYLISKELNGRRPALEEELSYKRAAVLLQSLETGAYSVYKTMLANEQELFEKRAAMSELTQKLLCSFDYDAEFKKRKEIFNEMQQELKKFNRLHIDQNSELAPQFYPLLIDEDIRDVLINRNIFTPLMWRRTMGKDFEGLPEQELSKNLICIPISTEYSDNDVKYLLKTVISAIT